MALDPPSTWGPNVRARITAVGITDTSKITNAQLDTVWEAITAEHREQLTTKAKVTEGITGSIAVLPHPIGGAATGTHVTLVKGPIE